MHYAEKVRLFDLAKAEQDAIEDAYARYEASQIKRTLEDLKHMVSSIDDMLVSQMYRGIK